MIPFCRRRGNSMCLKSIAMFLCFLFWTLTGLPGSPGLAVENDTKNLPDPVTDSLAYLVDHVQTREPVDMEGIQALLEFVDTEAMGKKDWKIENLLDATGAYFGYLIESPVDRIVNYLYHPNIPPSIFHPSVVRVGEWAEKPEADIPRLWENLDLEEVVALHGEEKEEVTPDINTGGYYSYTTDRLIILARHDEKKYLLSISKQTDESSVGHKGVVVGDDADWNYYYSDEEGLTKTGLGWVNSYIFDSFSVTVLSASKNQPEVTQHVMFKWVRAGWSGMNMVRTEHVRRGCQRFAQSLTRLMESEKLPPVDTLAAMTAHVQNFNDQELNHTLRPYIQNLRKVSVDDPVLSRRAFKKIISDTDPLEHYSRKAKEHVVIKEFLKNSVGMPTMLTMSHDEVLVSFLR